MRLLVTGGAGTLGNLLVSKYRGVAESIHVIDNFATSTPSKLKELKDVKVTEGSVANLAVLAKVFEDSKPTHVIHLAASYKDPDDWLEDSNTNVTGMINTLKLASAHSVSKFLNIQTVLCYGRPTSLPISEVDPLRPESSYAISKVAAEQYLINGNIPFVSLRLGNVISPGLAIGPIPAFYKNITANRVSNVTESKRDFLDSDDFLELVMKVLEDSSRPGVYNVSTGVGTSMLEIYKIVAEYLGSELTPNVTAPAEDDIPEIVLSAAAAKRDFGWEAKTSVLASVRKCLESYDRDGVGATYSHLRT